MAREWHNLAWSEKTAGERVQTSIAFVIAIVIALGMFGGGLMVLGGAVDGMSRHNVEHDRCLKRATNGYEIRACR